MGEMNHQLFQKSSNFADCTPIAGYGYAKNVLFWSIEDTTDFLSFERDVRISNLFLSPNLNRSSWYIGVKKIIDQNEREVFYFFVKLNNSVGLFKTADKNQQQQEQQQQQQQQHDLHIRYKFSIWRYVKKVEKIEEGGVIFYSENALKIYRDDEFIKISNTCTQEDLLKLLGKKCVICVELHSTPVAPHAGDKKSSKFDANNVTCSLDSLFKLARGKSAIGNNLSTKNRYLKNEDKFYGFDYFYPSTQCHRYRRYCASNPLCIIFSKLYNNNENFIIDRKDHDAFYLTDGFIELDESSSFLKRHIKNGSKYLIITQYISQYTAEIFIDYLRNGKVNLPRGESKREEEFRATIINELLLLANVYNLWKLKFMCAIYVLNFAINEDNCFIYFLKMKELSIPNFDLEVKDYIIRHLPDIKKRNKTWKNFQRHHQSFAKEFIVDFSSKYYFRVNYHFILHKVIRKSFVW
nr:MAG: hypothetical protein [Porcellio scaber clopovirus]